MGVDDGGLHAAPPVLVFGVEDAQVDEGGEGGRGAGRGELNFNRASAGALTPLEPARALPVLVLADGLLAARGLLLREALHDPRVERPQRLQELRQAAERPAL